MPSLMPGTPGAKEAYGISPVNEDYCFNIPPAACKRYKLAEEDSVILVTGHRGEGGFGLMKKSTGEEAVFGKYIREFTEIDTVLWFNEKAYAWTAVTKGKVKLTPEMMDAYYLNPGERLLVIKSTTVTMSFTPVEIWKRKFEQRGFHEAVKNMEKLEVF